MFSRRGSTEQFGPELTAEGLAEVRHSDGLCHSVLVENPPTGGAIFRLSCPVVFSVSTVK